MNKLVLILAFIAFSGTNVLAAGLPRIDEVKPGMSDRLELTSTHFADPPPEPPTRGGSDIGS